MPAIVYRSDAVPPLAFPRRFRNFLRRAMAVTGFEPADGIVHFILLDEKEMTDLNALHLHHSGPTDVITYDLRPASADAVAAEIYLCPAVAAKYAAQYGNTVSRELCLYAVHGLLHLSGQDDLEPTDRAAMRAAETSALEILGRRFQLDCIASLTINHKEN